MVSRALQGGGTLQLNLIPIGLSLNYAICFPRNKIEMESLLSRGLISVWEGVILFRRIFVETFRLRRAIF